MKIMAVDLGLVRTGLAISDEMELLASPVGTITERNLDVLAGKVAEMAEQHGASALVVGLPRNMDGSKGESALRAEAFADQLRELTGLSVSMWDERLTTMSAIGCLNETNVRGKKRKAIVDTVSATIILEDYLKSRK